MEEFLHTTRNQKHVKHNKQVKWKRTELYSSGVTTRANVSPSSHTSRLSPNPYICFSKQHWFCCENTNAFTYIQY